MSEFMFDGERCEICMEIIVDQGVLDCCNGRFCFVCIDNWATITTLCPLCQGEIQTIKCVPAYDKFGSKVDTELFARDCDWDGEEEGSDAIYFPSCYIDENAVTCLGGDECKLRGGLGSVMVEEESNLDTSIACDSCDIWYHAFCVGFDLDDTSSLTWLCPRCMVDDEQQRPSKKTLLQVGNSINEEAGCIVDASFAGRLSVSLADVGETAVVVSLVDVNGPLLGSAGITPFSNVSEIGLPGSPSKASGMEKGSSLSRSYGTPSTRTSNSIVDTSNIADETSAIPQGEDGFSPIRTSAILDGEGLNVCSSSKVESATAHLDFQAPGEENKEQYGGTEFETIEECKDEGAFEGPSFACTNVDKFEPLVIKQVCKSWSADSDNGSSRLPTSTSMTKEAVEKEASSSKKTLIFKDKNVGQRCVVKEKVRERHDYITDDIMSIVRGTGRRRRNLPSPKVAFSGPRLKKIRRVSAEEYHSSAIIQKLRKDIREAARDNPTEDPGKNLFETKLMDAFKTAVVGPTSGGHKKESRVVGKGKNELWKMSRVGDSELEKINTLKSVLANLRNGSCEVGEVKKERWPCRDDKILSRLYLADTSVVPRKNDIKPFFVTERFPAEEVNKKEVENGPRGSLFSPRSNNIAGSGKPKESNSKPITDRSDKKRWALEVLGRKTGVTGGGTRTTRTVPKDDKNTALFKANYPLLSHLPYDMLPIITPDQSCKVPTSLRQVQLNRIAEHFLRKADLPCIRRTAVTELAVADAINIENSLARTSNCKSVYLSLCSRELLRSSHKAETAVTAALSVEAALKSAGFLSDSPPTSPDCPAEVAPAPTEPDNILETSVLDPELNIYGDFDYDLGEHDYINSTTVKTVEPEVKMKVVLSVPDPEQCREYVKLQNDPSTAPEESFQGIKAREGGEELLREECMELYGPDKEPRAEKDMVVMESLRKRETRNPIPENAGDSAGSVAEAPAPPSPCHSETAESLPAVPCKRKKPEAEHGSSVYEKVRVYVKEHIRPLWRSGVITGDEYRRAAKKTTEKVMRYHRNDTDATFLVKEGYKVRKLADQYVQACHHHPSP